MKYVILSSDRAAYTFVQRGPEAPSDDPVVGKQCSLSSNKTITLSASMKVINMVFVLGGILGALAALTVLILIASLLGRILIWTFTGVWLHGY